jgi:hypothetical protein
MQQINTNKNKISITSAKCSNANENTAKSANFSRMFNTTSASSSSSPPPQSPPPSLIVKSEIEQHNAIKMQQMEAIRLIQISLDKLSSTTTVQLPKPKSSPANNNNNNNTSTILVYKESNLHKNLLVSKILNKAKYFYYQSIVQTMRLSLISKLNYYSSLIQQLNERNNADETSIVDEMKHLMDQILHETYQFNMNSSADDQINLSTHVMHRNVANVLMGENNTVVSVPTPPAAATTPTTDGASSQSVNYHHNGASHISIYQDDLEKTTATSSSSSIQRHDEQLQTEKNKRIKQLNDVKISLYSLLFNSNSNNASINSSCTADSQSTNTIKKITDEKCENTTNQSENKHLAKKFTANFSNTNNSNISNPNSNSNKQLNNFKKRLLDRKKDSSNLMGNDSLNKRPRKMANTNSSNNSNNLILADDTNVLDNRFNIKNKRSTTKTNATKFKRSTVKISSGRSMKLRPNVAPIYDGGVYRPCPLV